MMAVSAIPDEYLMVKSDRSVNSALSFTAHKLLGGFQITKNKLMVKKLEVPKLIATDCMKRLSGTDLSEGFGIATTISDYRAYHKLKEEFFLKWLVEENYHKGVVEKKFKRPNFICIGGRITDPLMTPAISRFGKWEIFAAKFNDTIYLWDEKEIKTTNEAGDLWSYYGIYFEHLLTQPHPDPAKINEFDKVFSINEITFGSHQLLCLTELDAKGKNGEWAEIKVHKKCSPKNFQDKFLKYWAQCIVPGIKTLLIGEHDNGILQNVDVTTTDALARKCDIKRNDCYDFEDRLLKFISSHFQVNDRNVVKKFSWKRGDDRVNVEDVSETNFSIGMLPPWYINAVQESGKCYLT